jgi:YaiO family outer membrane protein
MGHQDLAEPVYRSVLIEDPGNIEAMLGVAAALLARDEPAEAIEILDVALGLAPDDDEVLGELGRAERLAGRTAQAIAYFERAVSIAPTEQHRLSLEDARRAYLHRVETRGVSEQFSTNTPDSRSGDVRVNIRLTDTWRVVGRGQAQRKFAVSEERGGGGVEWRWKRATTLRAQALVGPGNRIMPERDYLGEVQHAYKAATWTASVRHFAFAGASTTVFSPGVAWAPEGPLSVAVRYAAAWTDARTGASLEVGHSALLEGAFRVYPRVSIQAGYAAGVEDFENFSIDRIGDFRANTFSGGLRVDLPTLTALVGRYEYQRQRDSRNMGRVTVSFLQSF